MAQLPEAFDPNAVEPSSFSNEPIPAGKYKLQVIESNVRETSTGSGEMLELTLEVVEGQFERRRIWDRLNIRNNSAEAQRIAQQSFRALCLSMGIDSKVTDSEVLHFKPFMARVTIQTDRNGQYPPQNRVQYLDPTSAKAQTASKPNAQQAARAAMQANSGTAPKQYPSANKPWNNPNVKAAGPNDDIPF